MESPTAQSAELEPVDEPEVLAPRAGRRWQEPASEPPRAPFLARARAAALIILSGIILAILGVLLSLTVIFIWIGLPMFLVGVGLAVAAVLTLLGGGRIVVRRF